MKISFIIPTFNAGRCLGACLDSIRQSGYTGEIIVSDGGSTDATGRIALSRNARVIYSDKGRGTQLNNGASAAQGDVFVFLHADSIIAKDALVIVQDFFSSRNVLVGKLSLNFDIQKWPLSVYAFLARFDSFWTSFGDQGIVVRKDFFNQIGGFPDWPLLEDVYFFQKARKFTRVHAIPAHLITSSVRFVKNGLYRQQLFNGRILLKYLMGACPRKLASEYENY